jgi:EAL domain-containing protein (putative c-di-GMP-specific phosphodiesterase class I)
MSHQYLYLKLLLRNNLLLDLDEYALIDTRQQGLVCSFMDMKLASAFQLVLRADGQVVGREALLRAGSLESGELTPEAVFAYASNPIKPLTPNPLQLPLVRGRAEPAPPLTRGGWEGFEPNEQSALKAKRLVQFDRLVRIIHLMNHARSAAEHELLFLNVHPQLLTSVKDHGSTFERILHYYSVSTSQVVIEIKETADTDDAVLTDAVNNYRNLGYRIAVDDFGAAHSSLERVLKLKPDIVKLDGVLIQAAERSNNAATSFNPLVDKFHDAGIQVAVEGIETARQLEIARKSGADLLQGYHLARPEFAAAGRGQLCRAEQLVA